METIPNSCRTGPGRAVLWMLLSNQVVRRISKSRKVKRKKTENKTTDYGLRNKGHTALLMAFSVDSLTLKNKTTILLPIFDLNNLLLKLHYVN